MLQTSLIHNYIKYTWPFPFSTRSMQISSVFFIPMNSFAQWIPIYPQLLFKDPPWPTFWLTQWYHNDGESTDRHSRQSPCHCEHTVGNWGRAHYPKDEGAQVGHQKHSLSTKPETPQKETLLPWSRRQLASYLQIPTKGHESLKLPFQRNWWIVHFLSKQVKSCSGSRTSTWQKNLHVIIIFIMAKKKQYLVL